MKTVNISKLDLTLSTEQIIDYCLDNGIDTVVNDIGGVLPFVEYELDDLLIFWNVLRKAADAEIKLSDITFKK
jgi:hypothetical protein